jgi:DNA-directed RNA polymerase subunit RPC12/RpoP
MVHRCPRCGGSRAERRTAKNYRERAALAIFGFHPYRCLDCDRRFLDRPLSERTGHDDGPAAADEPEPEAPGTPVAVGAPLDQRAATIAITTGSGSEPARVRRRARWVVDAGNGPLGRAEVYTLVVAGLLAVAVVFAVLRLMWPEATGGVKLGVD